MPPKTKSQSPQKNTSVDEKVAKVNAASKQLWATHDHDKDRLINGQDKIKEFLSESFKKANLQKDFKNLGTDKLVDQYMLEEVKAQVEAQKLTGLRKVAMESYIELNADQIQSVVKKIYKVEDKKPASKIPTAAKKPDAAKAPPAATKIPTAAAKAPPAATKIPTAATKAPPAATKVAPASPRKPDNSKPLSSPTQKKLMKEEPKKRTISPDPKNRPASPDVKKRPVSPVRGDYAEFYKDTLAMAKDKNMSEDQITAALGNRPKTQIQVNNWKNSKGPKKDKKGIVPYKQEPPKSTPLVNRLYQDAQARKEYKQNLVKEKEMKEKKEMDKYQHKLYNNDDKVRTLDEFMQDQFTYEAKRNQRIQDQLDQRQDDEFEGATFRPEVNPLSTKIVQYKTALARSGQLHPEADASLHLATQITHGARKRQEREQEYKKSAMLEEQYSFRPQISEQARGITRGFDDLLQDGQRKQQQKEAYERELKKKMKVSGAQINPASDKVMHDRFDQDFNSACKDLGVVRQESPERQIVTTQIGCAQMSQIFLRLGFVSQQAWEAEQLQLAEIWKMIGGDPEGQGQIPLGNCKNFLRAIQNFHHQDIMDTQREGPGIDPTKLGRQCNQGLLFKPAEIEFVTRSYRELYKNRQDRLASDQKAAHEQRAAMRGNPVPQYRPRTNQTTARLADKKNQSILNGAVPQTIEERLFYASNALENKKANQKAKYDEQLRTEHTFQPQISPLRNQSGPRTARHREEQAKYPNQWEYLYGESQTKNKNNKRDLTKEDVEFYSNPKEYTFQPNSSPTRKDRSESPNKSQLSSPDKQVFKINVNIGGEKKIIVANVHSDASQVAYQFMRKHSIEEKYHETLTELIADQQEQLRGSR